MATFSKFQVFVENLAEKVHNLGADTLKIALTNTAPNATDATFSQITEISAGAGYSAGGTAVNVTASSQTGGTYKLVGDNVVFTASSGSIGPFRYAVLYNDTPTSPADPLIGYWDRGTSITLADGDATTVDLDQAAGILTVT